MVNALAVVGTGLIGTSAALAAQRAGVARVTGWDADADTLAVAAERGRWSGQARSPTHFEGPTWRSSPCPSSTCRRWCARS